MRDLQEDLVTFESAVAAIVNGEMGEWVKVVLPEALGRAIKAEQLIASHAPEGHNFTNQQYIEMRARLQQAEAQVIEAKKIAKILRKIGKNYMPIAIWEALEDFELTLIRKEMP